jgi:putative ABC transport system permease protein
MMTGVYLNLVAAGLKRRRLEVTLTVLVAAVAAATLTVALGIGRVADRPWERTFEATQGAHVNAMAIEPGADLTLLERRPGVVGSTGVRPVAISSFRHEGGTYGLRLIGADGDSRVSRPLVQTGSWVERGGVVLERSFAEFLGLVVGDRLQTANRPLRVVGIAVVSQGEAYPASQPGLAFALVETIATVAPDRARWGAVLGLRLAAPEASEAFVAAAQGAGYQLEEWQRERADAVDASRTAQVILSIFAALLLLAGGAVLATLVGGRVLAQLRQIGLLKAAGLTPAQIVRLVLLEQVGLALAGCALGVAAGVAVTPLFVARTASLLNASETPPVDALSIVLVVGAVLVSVVAFTFGPAWRIGRRSVGSLLAGAASTGRRSRLVHVAERLGLSVPVELGARDAFGRPGRAALTALSLGLSVAAVVCTLAMEASLDVATTQPPAAPIGASADLPAFDPVDDDAGEGARLRPIVYSLDLVLLFVGLSNLLATILLSLRERTRNLGLLKAAGLTPRQLIAAFLTSQAAVASTAALAGIPIGLLLFRAAIEVTGSTDEFGYPRVLWLVLLAPAAVATVLAVATPLARRAAAQSVTEALRYE